MPLRGFRNRQRGLLFVVGITALLVLAGSWITHIYRGPSELSPVFEGQGIQVPNVLEGTRWSNNATGDMAEYQDGVAFVPGLKDLSTLPLERRTTASEAEFYKAMTQGTYNLQKLEMTAWQIPQSSWLEPKAMEEHGWKEMANEFPHCSGSLRAFAAIKGSVQQLGISTNDQHWALRRWEHKTFGPAQGNSYGTQRFHCYLYNVRDGAIVIDQSDARLNRMLSSWRASQLPLKEWSDITWLSWQIFAGKTNAIKHVFWVNMAHQDASHTDLQLVEGLKQQVKARSKPRLLGGLPPLSTWPTSGDIGKALLGTEGGTSVSQLLWEHKRQMGVEVVEQASVIITGKDLHLHFPITLAPGSVDSTTKDDTLAGSQNGQSGHQDGTSQEGAKKQSGGLFSGLRNAIPWQKKAQQN